MTYSLSSDLVETLNKEDKESPCPLSRIKRVLILYFHCVMEGGLTSPFLCLI